MLLSLYPKLVREYLVFPVNIFDADTDSAGTLLFDYLGLSSLLPCVIALVLGLIVVRFDFQLPASGKAKLIVLIVILLLFSFTLQRPSPQPLIYSLQTESARLMKVEKRVVPSIKITTAGRQSEAMNRIEYSGKDTFDYCHIILIVLEGVTAGSFEKEFLTIPNGFYSKYKSSSVYYDNYYSCNLDSYTSLIAMLTSVMVPYRAYADADLYDKVNTAPSLTEDFRNHGFNNYFISCYQYQPFVPTKKFWDKIYERSDLPSHEQWLTLGSSKMEMATEDKAALSTIVNMTKSKANSFILHEMVYGHSPEWRATTGKTQNEYYNEYLMELSQKLTAVNEFDHTLFVIVSDHGDRAQSSDVSNYRVPLLIVGRHVTHRQRGDWLSHTDLPGIIYHYSKGGSHPEPRNEMMFVGSTEKWVYGMKNAEGESVFFDNASGVILAQAGNVKAIDVMEKFQRYVNAFNAVFGNEQ